MDVRFVSFCAGRLFDSVISFAIAIPQSFSQVENSTMTARYLSLAILCLIFSAPCSADSITCADALARLAKISSQEVRPATYQQARAYFKPATDGRFLAYQRPPLAADQNYYLFEGTLLARSSDRSLLLDMGLLKDHVHAAFLESSSEIAQLEAASDGASVRVRGIGKYIENRVNPLAKKYEHPIPVFEIAYIEKYPEESTGDEMHELGCYAEIIEKSRNGSETKGGKPGRLLSAEPPVYPVNAARGGYDGSTDILLTVDARGILTAARVVRSSGKFFLDMAALDAVYQYRFAAGKTENGEPSGFQAIQTVVFRLRDP
jgi:TonB family protein